ncbi:MAG: hypothetical protein BKP49_07955 [Treponema sp. CETP13]|nr:MAG: hypothetical protein BKP49_07955 [Treponema sp. CETP13]
MYSREIKKTLESVLKRGVPQFGTYATPPRVIDVHTLKQPYNLMPLPRFITNKRIRGNIEYFFSTDTYIGTIDILDSNWFCFTETNFWEHATGKKLSYRCFLPLRHIVPHHLDNSVCVTFRKNRYFRMSWDHIKKTFSFVFHFENDAARPEVAGVFNSSSDEDWGLLTSITPYPLKNRCSVAHVSAMPIKGSISTSTTKNSPSASDAGGMGLFSMRWSFCSHRTKDYSLTGFGDWNGKRVVFKIYTTSQDPINTSIYNENVLFVDGEATPLPPIRITQPKGILGTWVVQDIESMVDLAFHPISDTKRTVSALIMHTEYHTMFGKCDGNIRTKEGYEIPLKKFFVIAKKHTLRL